MNGQVLDQLYNASLFKKYKPRMKELRLAIEVDDTIKIEQIFNEIKEATK